MSLLDRSPGGFITAANAVLYGTVLLECLMLLTGSPVAMYGFLAMIVAVCALLCRWMMMLMGPEDAEVSAEAIATPVAAPAPAAVVPRRRSAGAAPRATVTASHA